MCESTRFPYRTGRSGLSVCWTGSIIHRRNFDYGFLIGVLSYKFCNTVGCVFLVVIWSEFRMGQCREYDYWEDALHFTKARVALGLKGV